MKRLLVATAAALVACHAAPPSALAPSPPAPQTTVPVPAALGFDSAGLAQVTDYLRSQVDSAFPSAVVAVGRHGRLALLAAVGHYGQSDPRPVTPETIYDLASLTKVIGLTTVCMLLVDEGKLDLDAPVQRYLPEFRGSGKDRVTIRHLLTHSSGLPAWRPLWREAHDRSSVLALVDTTPLDTVPGVRFEYSDLGAIALMQVVERITGKRIDRFLEERVFQPLGMTATRYLPPASWRDRIAPTEDDTAFRHRVLLGEVHDENAGRMGGVSGHAGLFSNALDLSRFADWYLAQWGSAARTDLTCVNDDGGCPPKINRATVRAFTSRQNLPPGSSRAIGWDTPSQPSSAGTKLSALAFGHTGYTGTSIWFDPERDLFIILLTNRVHPTRANTKILQVRPRVADLVMQACMTCQP
jgi:serine-type D-Ala-D-Ala carboxypeptidase